MTGDDPLLLTVDTPVPGLAEVVNGTIKLRKTHPNLWRAVMVYAVISLALGLNFIVLQPTFSIFDMSNYVWGSVFLTLGLGKIVFTNVYQHLRLLRATMASEVAYTMFLAWGTTEPFFDGVGSLQLPILYIGLAVLELPLLLEPFLNPLTARRD